MTYSKITNTGEKLRGLNVPGLSVPISWGPSLPVWGAHHFHLTASKHLQVLLHTCLLLANRAWGFKTPLLLLPHFQIVLLSGVEVWLVCRNFEGVAWLFPWFLFAFKPASAVSIVPWVSRVTMTWMNENLHRLPGDSNARSITSSSVKKTF